MDALTFLQDPDALDRFVLVFLPIFVAIDVIGVLPTYYSLTHALPAKDKPRIARQSVVTAFSVTVMFILLGKATFSVLGVRVEDFMIAGGVLLLVFAIWDLLRDGTRASSPKSQQTLGVVPLGTPIIAGPATLTTSLMLMGTYGVGLVALSLGLNLLLAWVVVRYADRVIGLLGVNGATAIAKVFYLLLAAIAVSMIRRGVMGMLGVA
ncbi:MAG TPA: MarC family protein [Nitrospiria bacterium]|nr:MarC family protein [Nitrospiria bacterium]